METEKVLSDGIQNQKFYLIEEPNTKLPCWLTTVTEVWLNTVSDLLYTYIKEHPILFIKTNTIDPKSFAASISINNFKTLQLSGEAARFRDSIFELYYAFISRTSIRPPYMYIAYYSGSNTNNLMNAMIEIEKDRVLFCSSMNGTGK